DRHPIDVGMLVAGARQPPCPGGGGIQHPLKGLLARRPPVDGERVLTLAIRLRAKVERVSQPLPGSPGLIDRTATAHVTPPTTNPRRVERNSMLCRRLRNADLQPDRRMREVAARP